MVLSTFSDRLTTWSHVRKMTNMSSTPTPSSRNGASRPSWVHGYNRAADRPMVKPSDRPMETMLAIAIQNLKV